MPPPPPQPSRSASSLIQSGRTVLVEGGYRWVPAVLHLSHLVQLLDLLLLLLHLHPSILEPDLDLSLRQTEAVGDLDASLPSEVPVELELLLQLQRLVPRVRLATTPALRRIRSCMERKQHRRQHNGEIYTC